MPRNRMIKVEFWDDEKLSSISRDARLTYIAMWNFSDDYGVIKGNHAWLKNNIYPYDEKLGLETFKKWLSELENLKRIIPFKTNGELYYHIPTFLIHQTINRPSLQRNPEPPASVIEPLNQNSDYSLIAHDVLIDEIKRKEIEKKRKYERSETAKAVINLLNKISGKNFGHGEANLEPIRGRLFDGFSLEECEIVLRNKWSDDKFDKKYFRPTTLFRPANFEAYLNENCKTPSDGQFKKQKPIQAGDMSIYE